MEYVGDMIWTDETDTSTNNYKIAVLCFIKMKPFLSLQNHNISPHNQLAKYIHQVWSFTNGGLFSRGMLVNIFFTFSILFNPQSSKADFLWSWKVEMKHCFVKKKSPAPRKWKKAFLKKSSPPHFKRKQLCEHQQCSWWLVQNYLQKMQQTMK